MKTKFGQKMRPEFTVIEYRNLDVGNPPIEEKAQRKLEQQKAKPKSKSGAEAIGKPVDEQAGTRP